MSTAGGPCSPLPVGCSTSEGIPPGAEQLWTGGRDSAGKNDSHTFPCGRPLVLSSARFFVAAFL